MLVTINIPRLRWAGHVKSMEENEFLRRIMECKPAGIRNRGKSMLRWMNGVGENLSGLGIKR